MECRLWYGLRHNLLDRLRSGLSLRLRGGRYCALDAILRSRRRLGRWSCDGLGCRLSHWLAGRRSRSCGC